MNDRERFVRHMHYQPVDRCPIWDFGFWDETLAAWREQGMPADVSPDDFFGMDAQWHDLSVNISLLPPFEFKVLEDRGDTEVVQQEDGVIALRRKWMRTIPHYIDWTLKDRKSWQEHFKPRLDPDTPGRIPDDFARRCRENADEIRTWPVGINAGSLFGWIRNWMGIENVSYLIYDDPALFGEMVETLADLTCAVLERALRIAKENGLTYDYAKMWEDMCYNQGPLVSPEIVRKYMQPHYRRITDLLSRYGIDIVLLDCDGRIDKLIPIWLDAGVNTMFPLEVGTWKADPVEYRKRFGKELRMMGGFDKKILASSKEAIEREVYRLAPLAEEGGYIPFCDHRVPADVPLDNYLHYVSLAKKVFGKGVNVKPTGTPVKVQK